MDDTKRQTDEQYTNDPADITLEELEQGIEQTREEYGPGWLPWQLASVMGVDPCDLDAYGAGYLRAEAERDAWTAERTRQSRASTREAIIGKVVLPVAFGLSIALLTNGLHKLYTWARR